MKEKTIWTIFTILSIIAFSSLAIYDIYFEEVVDMTLNKLWMVIK